MSTESSEDPLRGRREFYSYKIANQSDIVFGIN